VALKHLRHIDEVGFAEAEIFLGRPAAARMAAEVRLVADYHLRSDRRGDGWSAAQSCATRCSV